MHFKIFLYLKNTSLAFYFMYLHCFENSFITDIGGIIRSRFIEFSQKYRHVIVGSSQRQVDMISHLESWPYDLSIDQIVSCMWPRRGASWFSDVWKYLYIIQISKVSRNYWINTSPPGSEVPEKNIPGHPWTRGQYWCIKIFIYLLIVKGF